MTTPGSDDRKRPKSPWRTFFMVIGVSVLGVVLMAVIAIAMVFGTCLLSNGHR